MKALIDENGVVVQVEQQEFGVAPPCFWVDCGGDVVAYRFKYENGTIVPILEPKPVPPTAEENETTAKLKLQNSDWSVLPDVNLANKAEWETYRAALRNIALNPQEGDLNWPQKPQNVWS
jgi:hypothetical protein